MLTNQKRMILAILLSLILLLIGWLLIAPLRLFVDTGQGMLEIRWWGLGAAGLYHTGDDLLFRFRIFFWKKEIDLLTWQPTKKKKKAKKAKKKKKRGKIPMSLRKFRRLLKTFKILEWELDLDTDNYLVNGWLYPVFYFLNRAGKRFQINYRGRFYWRMVIENRGYRVLWALLR